jgi:hypothetical protein
VVPVSLAGPEVETAPRVGLVDTGAENVLAASWLADLAGVDLTGSVDTARIGIGGQVAEVIFAEVEQRLYAPDAGEEFVSCGATSGSSPGGRRRSLSCWARPASSIASRPRSTVALPCWRSRTGRRSTPALAPAPLVDGSPRRVRVLGREAESHPNCTTRPGRREAQGSVLSPRMPRSEGIGGKAAFLRTRPRRHRPVLESHPIAPGGGRPAPGGPERKSGLISAFALERATRIELAFSAWES